MALTPGTRLAAYEISAVIGAGGMGEVYRAKDTKLGRDVALKTLPASFTNDPERLARFRREAQVLASLNHPHIAQIHGLDEVNGTQFLVLELVDGESLEKRIATGPIPVDEALGIARQIAEALEAAHEKGIIHRDLKPANIALTTDGQVKVLDFGLAKAVEATTRTPSELSQSPTITSPAMTALGVILGTASYMAPEQAKGRPADKRSDIWAFGCVLYEMFTGKRTFPGEDVSDTLAAVLRGDPDWNALPSNLPDPIRALVVECLKKDRRDRIADISTAQFLLSRPRWLQTAAQPGRPMPRFARRLLPLLGSALVGAAAVVGLRTLNRSPAAPVIRFGITLPAGQRLVLARQAVALSSDGTRLAYVANDRLFLQSLSELEPRAIAEGLAISNPVFAPDGQSLLFWSDSMIKRISVSGGVPVPICHTPAAAPGGITWANDEILFGQGGSGIMRVSVNGGQPQVLVGVSRAEGLVYGPQMLPDGHTVLFTLAQSAAPAGNWWDQARVVVQSLKTGQRRTLIEGGTDARYVPTGHLVYAQGGTLLAVPFDLSNLKVAGGTVPVVEGVRRAYSPASAPSGTAHFSFSNTGSLVYVPGPASPELQNLFLFDGKGAAEPLKLPPGSYAYPRVSPDGKRLALEARDGAEEIVLIYDLSGVSSARRLTFGGNNRFPIWSSDGRTVAYQSDREADLAVFRQAVEGGPAERLTTPEPGTSHVPESWSPTGEILLYSAAKGSRISLWALSVRDRKVMPFDVGSNSLPTDAMFSPDGRFVAYQAGEAGQVEGKTYVQPFPPNGMRYEVANRGGRPLWSSDGGKLFYVPGPDHLKAVSVSMLPNLTFSDPVDVPRGFAFAPPSSPRPFDITRDGRIVAVADAGRQGGLLDATQIHVVLNWFDELKARVPTK